MNAEKFFSIIIIIVLVAAFLTAAAAPLFKPKDEKAVTDTFTLNESQVSGIKYVNINVESNSSGVAIEFKNTTGSVYSIETERNVGAAKPTVNYTVEGDTLNIDMKLDEGSATVLLSNKYTYNVTTNSKIGGVALILGNDSKIDSINSTIQYAGGGLLIVDKTAFKNISMQVNTGGFYIAVDPEFKGGGSIIANVTMGGVTVAPMDPSLPIKLIASVDLGGITFKPSGFNVIKNTTNYLEMQTKSYGSSSDKLEIISGVGLGGVNIGTFQMQIQPQ
ncbi:MAG TPA: hypothetical protein PLO64_04410 [Methanothermobacter sp.]|nr:conserved hypothetical protein [Methanothermobacter sp. MT-2]HHW05839.1 hypothetical protein [Methanothermobacter sp.]HOK72443.1 hypothetical protein [Methanothermobacter sp.]HOL69154.1 hypothetical protein [Methanothermobacter sp.]HPQ03930.1 hypothetical protein [Methanothermobacter sp.]